MMVPKVNIEKLTIPDEELLNSYPAIDVDLRQFVFP